MSLKQVASQTCAVLALNKLRHFVGSILLVIGVTAVLSSHCRAVFAEPGNEPVVTTETPSAIETDFFAYLLKGVGHDPAIEQVEDACAIRLKAPSIQTQRLGKASPPGALKPTPISGAKGRAGSIPDRPSLPYFPCGLHP
jgi:hypothetical protein